MKITLDIDKLLAEGKIDQTDYDTLRSLAATETTSLGLNILLGFGVVAVAGGMLALLASAAASIAIGLGVLGFGIYLAHFYADRWNMLSSISILIGALMFGGGIITQTKGSLGGFVLLALIYLAAGFATKSGLMVTLSAFAVLGTIGAIAGYEHAFYYVGVEHPLLTIIVFSILAAAAFFASGRFAPEDKHLFIVFSRASVFIVNMGFWIGSLWGDNLFRPRDTWDPVRSVIPDLVFVLAWAIALVLLGIWAVRNNRRWLVNILAVFGGIHFYTQWFERLGASPGTVVLAGLIAIGISLALFRYNRQPSESSAFA